MDGFQATEEIRKIENGKIHVPIVALTANIMPGIVEQCVQAGMDYCIFLQLRVFSHHTVVTEG
jgi:CheY-like chemotaxis protein